MLKRSDLRSYQEKACDHILKNSASALWLEPGLGKTVSTLTAIQQLRDDFSAHRTLVISPKRVAQRVWPQETMEWEHLQEITVATAIGTEQQRLDALKRKADVTTINWENVQWLEELFIQGKRQIRPWNYDLVVLDESQGFKSWSSQRFKSMKRLRKLFPRIVELTGTPAPNGYLGLWSQLYLLDRGQRLGENITRYKDRFFDQMGYEGYDLRLKPGAKEEIQRLISDIVLTMKAEDYLKELPEVIFNTIWIPMPASIRTKYKNFKRESVHQMESGQIVTAVNAAVLRGKLLQFANGTMKLSDTTWESVHNSKLDALTDFLETLNGPVLVGYAYTADRDRILAALKRLTPRAAVLRTDADFDRFKQGDFDIGVLHPGSAGHGLNDIYKSGCQHVVWYGLTANLEHYKQLNARITGGHRRMGKIMSVHHLLMDDTEDGRTLKLLTGKDNTQEELTRATADLVKEV